MPVLVLGPRGLLKNRPAVQFGKPNSLKPAADSLRQPLEDLGFSTRESRRLFIPQFAGALAAGDVEAVQVELKRPPDGGGASGRPGGGAAKGGAVGQPGGAGGLGGTGGEEAARDPLHGTAVPLDKAVPLTREQFLKLMDDRSDGPQK